MISRANQRPYRDVFVWLADIRPPDNNLFAERAIARVIALLMGCDSDPEIGPRWEEQFANARTNKLSLSHQFDIPELLADLFHGVERPA